MNAEPILSVSEKIKQIRKAKGLSIENLASVAKCSNATISRIENGQGEYSPEMVDAIKKYMGVEGAPLLEHEIDAFKDKLIVWKELVNAERVVDARAMQATIFPIYELPFEHDLSLRYNMIEVLLMLKETYILHDGNKSYAVDGTPYDRSRAYQVMEEKMSDASAYLDKASNETLSMYHSNKGFLCMIQNNIKDALEYYLKADEYIDGTNAGILSQIGNMYHFLSQPCMAIIYGERAKSVYALGRTHISKSVIDNRLALYYMHIKKYSMAKKIFESSLAQAKSINDNLQSGMALANLGLIASYTKMHDESARLFDEAFACMDGFPPIQKHILHGKALNLYKMKKYRECEAVLAQGDAMADAGEEIAILYESLRCLVKIATKKDSLATDYIENTAIPYLLNNGASLKLDGLYL